MGLLRRHHQAARGLRGEDRPAGRLRLRPKEPGEKNFLNDPGTWDLLDQVKALADRHGVSLLPEIHSRYEERIHETIAEKGFMTYDFFLPGLLIDALDRRDATVLRQWIGDIIAKGIVTVNMLGCHDGIPLLDLKGLLTDDQIDAVIERVKGRGGYVKDLHGEKKMYYQVNATYHSALGADDARLLFARAVQMFMPGKPQVWYLDLFAGENNLAAVEKAGSGGHKEINRTNLSLDDIREGLAKPVVKDQLELLRFRKTSPAFGFDAVCTVGTPRPTSSRSRGPARATPPPWRPIWRRRPSRSPSTTPTARPGSTTPSRSERHDPSSARTAFSRPVWRAWGVR